MSAIQALLKNEQELAETVVEMPALQNTCLNIVEREKHCQMGSWHKPVFYEFNSEGQKVVVPCSMSKSDIEENSEDIEAMR